MNKDNMLTHLFEMIHAYIRERDEDPLKSVTDFHTPDRLKTKIDLTISKNGISDDQLVKEMASYLEHCVDTGSNRFYNQLFSGFNLPAFMGEALSALTNTSMYTYEMAPVATLMEKTLIKKMCGMVGFDKGDGTFVTGGSNANLIAMFSARNHLYPDLKQKGIFNHRPLSVFVSDQSHYSLDIAANLLGLGTDHVYKIESDVRGCMIPEKLNSAISTSLQKGEVPLMVCATAGTTLLGAYDPIETIGKIAKKKNIWFHVDGAFGGSAILSNTHKSLLKGSEMADSFTWDAHKLMTIPLMCSVVLLKEKGGLENNLTTLDTLYLYHENDERNYNLGKKSIQCGRRVDALKLWLSWKYYGDSGYAARIDQCFELAQHAEQCVKASDKLELLAPVQSFSVCFQYINDNGVDRDAFNIDLRERLIKSGQLMVNYGYFRNRVAIRITLASPDVDKIDVDRFFQTILEIASQIEHE